MASTPLHYSTPMGLAGPIGVFDSGVGGLSVLRHIRSLLPDRDVLYFADSGFAPYGDRSEEEITERTLAIAEFLMQQQSTALVVACNTATAAAISALRQRYPALPLVGVEPGLKPAAALSKSGVVGVLATRSTLASQRFAALQEQITVSTNVRFVAQACVGLADQIEKGELQSAATATLLRRHVEPLIQKGADTLVLGCTHYPFILPLLENIISSLTAHAVTIVDTGAPVARQLQRLLNDASCAQKPSPPFPSRPNKSNAKAASGRVNGYTTGSTSALHHAFKRLLGWTVSVTSIKSD